MEPLGCPFLDYHPAQLSPDPDLCHLDGLAFSSHISLYHGLLLPCLEPILESLFFLLHAVITAQAPLIVIHGLSAPLFLTPRTSAKLTVRFRANLYGKLVR